MSALDLIADVVNATFGDPVTITPPAGAPWTGQGIFRENPREVMDSEGLVHVIDTPTLQVQRPLPDAVVKRAVVEPSIRPGEVWRVVDIHRDRSPALNAFAVLELEKPR